MKTTYLQSYLAAPYILSHLDTFPFVIPVNLCLCLAYVVMIFLTYPLNVLNHFAIYLILAPAVWAWRIWPSHVAFKMQNNMSCLCCSVCNCYCIITVSQILHFIITMKQMTRCNVKRRLVLMIPLRINALKLYAYFNLTFSFPKCCRNFPQDVSSDKMCSSFHPMYNGRGIK